MLHDAAHHNTWNKIKILFQIILIQQLYGEAPLRFSFTGTPTDLMQILH